MRIAVGIRSRDLRQRFADQVPNGLAGKRAGRLRFSCDGIQVGDDVVVDLIEKQQVFALEREVLAQVLFEHHVHHRHVGRCCAGRPHRLREQRPETILDHPPIGDDCGRCAVDESAGVGGKRTVDLRVRAQRAVGDGHVEFGGQLFAQGRLRLVRHAAEELHPLVGEAGAQRLAEGVVVSNRVYQPARFGQLRHAEQRARFGDVLREGAQGLEIAGGVRLPAVVEVGADAGDEHRAGVFVVLLPFTEEELDEATTRIVDPLLLLDVVLPRLGEHVVVDDPVRVLKPAEKGLSAFAIRARIQFASWQLLFGQAAVGTRGGRLDAPADAQVAKIAVGDAEDVEVLGGIPSHLQLRVRLRLAQPLGRHQIALQTAPIVIEDVRIGGDEALGAFLHVQDAGDDCQAQILRVFAWNVVDNGIDIALALQLERR